MHGATVKIVVHLFIDWFQQLIVLHKDWQLLQIL